MSHRWRIITAFTLIAAFSGHPSKAEEDAWSDFRFLIGSWVSDGKPELGTGQFSLEPELQGKVLVRRNVANVPMTAGQATVKHEDLMVIYKEPGGKVTKASYYDSEGHVILYTVTPMPDGKGLVFLSDAVPSAPRFRLSYTKTPNEQVAVTFEIAPPGKADAFKVYLYGTVRRKK